MRTKIMFVLVTAFALSFCLAASQPATASDEEDVLEVLTNFAEAMNTNDTDLMSSLWLNSQETSIFGPPKGLAFLYQGHDLIMTWFEDMNKAPLGSYVRSFHNPQVTMLDKNFALITAYSILIINPPAVEEQFVSQERTSLVVQKTGGKWLIVHAHFSVLPTE